MKVDWVGRVKAKYLTGSDMKLDEFLKLHRSIGNIFNFLYCFVNYAKEISIDDT